MTDAVVFHILTSCLCFCGCVFTEPQSGPVLERPIHRQPGNHRPDPKVPRLHAACTSRASGFAMSGSSAPRCRIRDCLRSTPSKSKPPSLGGQLRSDQRRYAIPRETGRSLTMATSSGHFLGARWLRVISCRAVSSLRSEIHVLVWVYMYLKGLKCLVLQHFDVDHHHDGCDCFSPHLYI